MAASLFACGSETPAGPRLAPSELERAVRERAGELWEPLRYELTEAWPGESRTFEVACRPTRYVDGLLSKGELMPYEIEFEVSQGPPFRSGVAIEVESAWSREVLFRDRFRGAGTGIHHELLVGVGIHLGERVRLPEDQAVWLQVAGKDRVTSSFWVRLYGLGQGRVAIEVPADGHCPVPAHRDGLWDFN